MDTQQGERDLRARMSQASSHSNDEWSRLRSTQAWRTRIIYLKVFINILFLFAWCIVMLNVPTYTHWDDDLGAHFWKLFGIYAGVSAGLPLFSLIGLLREGILTSQVWFESLWLLAIAGYDGYLVKQQTLFFPDFEWWAKFDSFQTPYVTIGKVFEVVTVVTLLADFFLSLGWSCFLLKSAWSNRLGSQTFLFWDAQRLPWLAPGARPHRFTSVGRMLFGRSTLGPSPIKAVAQGLWGWFFGWTMFRRFTKAEPISYPLLRGTVALLFWIVLFAYGILSCVINPITQFNPPRGKATRMLTKDSRYSPTWGHVSGFVTLGIIPSTQISTSENPCMKGQAGIQANYTDPLTSQVTSCMTSCSYTDLYRGDDWFLQPEVYWDCGAIWDNLPFKTAAPTPNTRPYITVTWDPKASTNSVVAAGLLSLHPDASAVFASVWFGNSPGNAHEWAPGLTFNFTSGPGLAYTVDVGRRKLYASKVTFLDLIGVPQAPDTVVTYPVLSVEPNTATTNNQSVTTLEFHAGFGAYNDEIYEEYIEHTVLFGLATSGGLYAALNVLYVLLFGRSLLVALFGGKPLSPFGKISTLLQPNSFRKNLEAQYPGIENREAQATSAFLHDFVLDLRPLENVEPAYEPDSTRRVNEDIESRGDRSDVTAARGDVELDELSRVHSYDDRKTTESSV